MGLFDSLGLDNVVADPNHVPDGAYEAEVSQAAFVKVDSKDTVSLVITYKVVSGTSKGAQKQDWFTLGTSPTFDDDGNLTGYTPTMSDEQKKWFKKRITLDLGVNDGTPDKNIPADFKPSMLVGIAVTMGTKTKDGYNNISYINQRTPSAAGAETPAGVTGLL